ncbi:MAG: copper resistance protein CopC [Alphaproteobacteria bacterium]|nr:copper resistance protein CopC [Alphaproteobacteria bacterium]
MRTSMISRVAVSVLAALSLTTFADAHAMLDKASPAVGSTVASAPRAVSLTFTEKVEGAFSTIRVENASGARVDTGKAQVEGGRNVLRVNLKSLEPGTYKVTWKVLSVDTHRTEGSFTFTVGR